jgi:hypothetical protein
VTVNEVIAGVEIPDTALVRRATTLVRDATDDALFNHCRRVYLWGTLLGRRRGLVVDPELLYVAAMFHDVGLTASYGRSEHFEIDGANAARDFLLRNGFASAKDARIVWLAIALHTSPGAADHVEAEIALVSAGIDSDVRGRHLDALTSDEIREVTAAHPAATTVGHRTGSAHRRNLVPLLTVATAVAAGLLGAVLT